MIAAQMERPLWQTRYRAFAILGGSVLAIGLALYGATALAQVLGRDREGVVIGLAIWVASLAGWYLVMAGFWGAWSLGDRAATRILTVRVLLGLAFLLASPMLARRPILNLATISSSERQTILAIGLILAWILLALVMVGRYPRIVPWAIAPLAVYSGLSLFAMAQPILAMDPTVAGPVMTLVFLLSSTFAVSLIAAFGLAWPLREQPPDHAD